MMNRKEWQVQKPPLSCGSWAVERGGQCGENVHWRLNPETGMLSIYGTGSMEDYNNACEVPWYRGRELVRKLKVEYGVTAIGDRAFEGCSDLVTVYMAETVQIIGERSFRDCRKIVKLPLGEGVQVISPEAFWDCAQLKIVYMPRSIRSIEGGAFGGKNSLSEVFYEGKVYEWKSVLISKACMDNDSLLNALVHADKWQQETVERETGDCMTGTDRYDSIVGKVREAVKNGGDGKVHILMPGLYAEKINSKTGDCTIVVFPQGKIMLIDTGVSECGGQIANLLDDLQINQIDYFICTHPHSDHIGGAMAIFNYLYENGGKICRYYHNGYRNNVVEETFKESLRVRGAEIRSDIAAGERWTIDDVTIDILAPDAERRAFGTGAEEINNLSIVMRFSYGLSSYLTAGDLYVSQERWMAAAYGEKLAADVTKLSHHGLLTSNCREWIEAVSPKIAVALTDDVGCGKVIKRVRDVGAEYYCTGIDGMLCVSMDDKANYELVSQFDSVLHELK